MALTACNIRTSPQGRELKLHGTALFPVACYYDDLTTESLPWHWHDELEALIVVEGTAAVTAGTESFTGGRLFLQYRGAARGVECRARQLSAAFGGVSSPAGRRQHRQRLLAGLSSAFAGKSILQECPA